MTVEKLLSTFPFYSRWTLSAGMASASSSLKRTVLLHRCASFVANESGKMLLPNSLPAGSSAHVAPSLCSVTAPAGVATFRFIQFPLLIVRRLEQEVVTHQLIFYEIEHFLDMEQNSGDSSGIAKC
ncbi:hypothetical protein [Planococcus salinus]|uniref:Uncharacterized protein n=1 Tax=Planococcus salinus TaxID=1848460 RepID=A0A3M8P5Z8_9BACL|nr:hypothetical protein [Planococcus salinus]RNF39108.1 hypothetical protein EEX84_10410 [Planococcus salinus]